MAFIPALRGRGLLPNLDKIKLSADPLASLIRLRQATGNPKLLTTDDIPSVKLLRMVEIVAEAVSNGQKVIVFSNWTGVTSAAEELLAEFSPLVITGEVDPETRQARVEKFKQSESGVALGTVACMGTGLTLLANVVIFLDEPFTSAVKIQCEDRACRIGSKGDHVLIYTLMCRDSIDERVHEIVESKREMSERLIDGKKPGAMEKAELVDFLLGNKKKQVEINLPAIILV